MTDTPHTAPRLDFSHLTDPTEGGLIPAQVAALEQVFRQQVEDGLHPGAQLLVARHGRVVVNAVAGYADRRQTRPVTPHTRFMAMSIGKSWLALTVLKLAEDGRLDLDAPIAQYWPEFGQGGKASATVRQALLHQAGIPKKGMYRQIPYWPRWEQITRHVARLPAEYPPGEKTAYHIVNFGFILGEVVRRVTGRMPDEVVRETLIDPLGQPHTSYGLPDALLAEGAELTSYQGAQRGAVWVFSLPIMRRALLPASNFFTTAQDVAVLYQMALNGGDYAGRRYLPSETIALAINPAFVGYDHTMQMPMAWGYGFQMGGHEDDSGQVIASMGDASRHSTFGYAGQGSSLAWADQRTGLLMVFLCNSLMGSEDARQRRRAISNAVWATLADE